MIVIIDYKMGNVSSIANMIHKVGGHAVISGEENIIAAAEKLILPGVGAFDSGMKNIESLGIRRILEKKVLEDEAPVLGICLGMQLLTKTSEEGEADGLGWINARTIKLQNNSEESSKIRIPHMGWNSVVLKKDSLLSSTLEEKARFYFVHSYHVVCEEQEDVLFETTYGRTFVSAINRKNIYGTQFHPEKSHKYGMRLMQNFVNLVSK